ncbi:MAG: branched-chain amino acid ABC transporter permease [Acidimicrobiia bacterium]|nr:branched-chain amino acid ABC transporter permease [Acidimicrobiia bacterium]
MDLGKILIDALRAALGVPAAAYAMSAIGLNLQFGYTGLLNFGHVASMAVGAYGLAITVDLGGPMWLGLIMGIVAALLLALLLGVPTLRLRADYLAIVTIAAGEILRFIVRSQWAAPFTGGIFGIQRFANPFFALNPIPPGRYGVGRLAWDARSAWVLLVGWALVALSFLLVARLIRSPWGRAIRAIREDEDAAMSLGKNVFGYKLQSLMIGGAIGALSGMFLAIDQQNVIPDSYIPLLTFYAFTVVIIGGPGSLKGPVVGAVVFWFLFELLDGIISSAIAQGWTGNLFETTDVGAVKFVFFGVGLMLVMVFRPQGMFGKKEEMLLDAQ